MSASLQREKIATASRFDVAAWFARYGTIVSLIALLVVFSVARPDVFPTVDNLLNIMNQISILGTMAFGLTVCLVMGLFDLSIAAMATLGGYVATLLLVTYPDSISVPVAVFASIAVSAAIGIVNGLIVSYLGISAFIATLATGSIITGAVLGISNSKTIITGIPDEFMAIGQGAIFGVSNPILIMLAVGFALWLLLEHTQLGRHLYAIGGSAEASRLSGIAVKRYAPFALAVCAACAGTRGTDGRRGARRWASAGRRRHLPPQRLRRRLHRRFVPAAGQVSYSGHPHRGAADRRHQQRAFRHGRGDLLAVHRARRAARDRVVQRRRPDHAPGLGRPRWIRRWAGAGDGADERELV